MLASRQSTVSSVRRDAWVEIDLNALEANVGTVRDWIDSSSNQNRNQTSKSHKGSKPGLKQTTQLMAVVKSDAYGHGALSVAEVLTGAGADWLAVASVDEGCQLRTVCPKTPILILSPSPNWALASAIESDLDLTLTDEDQIREIEEIAEKCGRKGRLHLKVDTGMHRLGVNPDRAVPIVKSILGCKNLQLTGIFSHLAKAGESDFTQAQNRCFEQILEKVKDQSPALMKSDGGSVIAHLACSEAVRRFPQTYHDLVRVGIFLYGLEAKTVSDSLQPALSVRARIIQMKEIDQGNGAGYNLDWRAQRKSRLACLPIGYADGVDRSLSNRITGILAGKQVKQAGLISMDQMLFDVTDVPGAQVGDVITLIGTDGGASIHLADWANLLGTITYDVACRLRVRLPKIYTRHFPVPPRSAKSP